MIHHELQWFENQMQCFLLIHGPIRLQVSHEKNPPTFHYTGWLIGILTLVYYNPGWVV